MDATATSLPAGADIRARREAAGITREQLAIAAGVSVTWAAQIERGYEPRHGDARSRIVRALERLSNENGSRSRAAELTTPAEQGPTDEA